jgi:hypothetical protein
MNFAFSGRWDWNLPDTPHGDRKGLNLLKALHPRDAHPQLVAVQSIGRLDNRVKLKGQSPACCPSLGPSTGPAEIRVGHSVWRASPRSFSASRATLLTH